MIMTGTRWLQKSPTLFVTTRTLALLPILLAPLLIGLIFLINLPLTLTFAVAVALPEVVDPEPLKPPASLVVVVNASHLLSPLLK